MTAKMTTLDTRKQLWIPAPDSPGTLFCTPESLIILNESKTCGKACYLGGLKLHAPLAAAKYKVLDSWGHPQGKPSKPSKLNKNT
ncbi:hypothetical protein N7466_005447 [Penicillium verhagenii]|uniref:uncharacterized protein n=1 Tax=Penicillium verhagenii TaxID=1562060 RepID=UPI0025455DF9|nr:uncharacterized protein N7466_005447 [Penicillium verhagenii]KAJ5929954.1 hypothetical protein N7466_005447 [Penicillium verhagenii]